MPTFSLLKKKRTKDSSGSKDLGSPSSPTGNTPVTPTSSGGFNNSSTPPSSNPPSQDSSNKTDDPMLAHQTSQNAGQGPSKPQQLPGINSLVNPSQGDGTAQSQMDGSNGADLASNNTAAATPVIRTTKGKYSLTDFTIQRTLGTGSFGRVHLVQSKHNQRFYAVKVLKKQQVVKMKQVEHTNDERRMLQRVKHAFLITLWGTFQDSKNLYMVMDFVEGGELFSLLRKSQVSGIDCSTDCDRPYTLHECMTHWTKAFPQSCRQILRSRSHTSPGLPPLDAHHLPGPQT